MFKIIDNGKLARYPEQNIDPSWTFPDEGFKTFQEAKEYADKYLGLYGPFPYSTPNKYSYSGYGDILEIIGA